MNNSAIGSNWDDFEKEIFSPEEISEMNKELAKDLERLRSWNKKKIRYKQLDKLHYKGTELKKLC